MNPGSVPPRFSPGSRWLGAVITVFGVQVALIFWLGSRAPAKPRPVANAPALKLVGNGPAEFPAASPTAEMLALTDPTLFALPHSQGFSGPAWLQGANAPVGVFDWPDDTNAPALPEPPLGMAFSQFMATNRFDALQTALKPEPPVLLPECPPLAIPEQSTLRIAGGLAQRRLLTPLILPSWPPRTNNALELDLVAHSRLQMVVDAKGSPVSIALLESSGMPAADQYALDQARSTRFEPLVGANTTANPLARLTWGELFFQWHTAPRRFDSTAPH